MGDSRMQPVLILGAGINGASVARELVLSGVPVWVVDVRDVACGATSRSSRLIHGGLRYLEYGDVRLVRESLEERSRLRRLAPQFVRPLRLHIPVSRRWTGLFQAAGRFVNSSRWSLPVGLPWGGDGKSERGLWVVRTGLWMYDRLVHDPEFPPSKRHASSTPGVPRVDARRFPWMCAYSDAQMLYPERFVVALLEDTRRAAEERGIEFRVLTWHRTHLAGGTAVIEPVRGDGESVELRPPVVVNATGAWGDFTLRELGIPSRRLFGGTRGSHLITFHRGLREELGDSGVYAEASDGRLVFVLPFGEGVMVGTTDERFEAPPDQAVATEPEIEYLLEMTNELFPQAALERSDVALHYCGVRPLPNSDAGKTAAISRDHFVTLNEDGPLPVFTLIGGKLTTCRAFGELAADQVLARLERPRVAWTEDRIVPGGEEYPQTEEELRRGLGRIAERHRLEVSQVVALWPLYGTRLDTILSQAGPLSGRRLAGTAAPLELVRWTVAHEWATSLEDLIERRLMLLYHPALSRRCIEELADCLVEQQRLAPEQRDAAVAAEIERLQRQHGKALGAPERTEAASAQG